MERAVSLRRCVLLLSATLVCGPCGVSADERVPSEPVSQDGLTHIGPVEQMEFMQKIKFTGPQHHVSCGGHYAETCAVCPQGQGEEWCNGDCVWVWGMCQSPTNGTGWDLFCQYVYHIVMRFVWWWWYIAPIISFHGIGMLIYACVYKNRVVSNFDGIMDKDITEDINRETPFFAVFYDLHQCAWAFCCAPVVAAKNFDVADVMGYWCSCFLMWTMYTPFWCVSVIFHSMAAISLQRKLRHKSTCFFEFAASLCCMPCAVGRESVELDIAACRKVECLFFVKDLFEPTIVEELIDGSTKEKVKDWWNGKDRGCCSP